MQSYNPRIGLELQESNKVTEFRNTRTAECNKSRGSQTEAIQKLREDISCKRARKIQSAPKGM